MGQNIRENTIEKELPFGLLNWYPWRKGVSVCCLGINADLFATELQSRGLQVGTLLETDKTVEGFDYIIEFGELERSQNPIALLQEWKTYLKPTGHRFLPARTGWDFVISAGIRIPLPIEILMELRIIGILVRKIVSFLVEETMHDMNLSIF